MEFPGPLRSKFAPQQFAKRTQHQKPYPRAIMRSVDGVGASDFVCKRAKIENNFFIQSSCFPDLAHKSEICLRCKTSRSQQKEQEKLLAPPGPVYISCVLYLVGATCNRSIPLRLSFQLSGFVGSSTLIRVLCPNHLHRNLSGSCKFPFFLH